MSAAIRPGEGQVEARTAAAQEFQPEIADILRSLQPQEALPGLLDPAGDALDVVGRVAESVNAQRRGRGRPAGSANRRNDEMFDYLEARGFKMPEVRLMELISADPRALAAAMSGTAAKPENMPFDKIMEVLRLQVKAAEVMMPYKFAKKQELKVEHSGGQVHIMVAGAMSKPGDGTGGKAFDLTGGAVEITENSGDAAGALVSQALVSHGDAAEKAGQSGQETAV
jgi:hypothetical protein